MEFLNTLERYIIGSEKRISLWYTIPTILFCVIYAMFVQKKNFKQMLLYVFNPRIYFSKHTFTDIFLLIFNPAFKMFLIVPFLYLSFDLTIIEKKILTEVFPHYKPIDATPLMIAGILTVISFILGDLSRFILHFSFHYFSFLWPIHKVHHNTPSLTPLTIYRVHPIESTIYLIRGITVTGAITGIFAFIFNGKIEVITLMKLNAIGFLFNMFLANLRHSHIPISFGIFENIFISPKMHQIHHSRQKKNNISNYGSSLSIWDILLNRHQSSKEFGDKKLRFGLPKSEWPVKNYFIQNLTYPIINIIQIQKPKLTKFLKYFKSVCSTRNSLLPSITNNNQPNLKESQNKYNE